MLSFNQKIAIQRIHIFESVVNKSNSDSPTELVVPSFFKIKELILEKLKRHNISKIECVKPYKANCIIRVYQSINYKHESSIISLYGAKCYVKVNGVWTTNPSSQIDFSHFTLRQYFFQDEYIDHDCEFIDCYVKIS